MITINCDVGEGLGNEPILMPYLSACNIACGGHAGDNDSMRQVVALAQKHQVRIGAHPSYPDKANFGRVSADISPESLLNTIQQQIKSLEQICHQLGATISHIKPHGALYNDIATKPELANHFVDAIEPYKNDYKLYVPYLSVIENEAISRGFDIVYEAFADRNYTDELTLVSRAENNSVFTNLEQIVQHVSLIKNTQAVRTISGKIFPIKADTFCVHSDTQNALEIVRKLHATFNQLP